jgi:hypothetical protein
MLRINQRGATPRLRGVTEIRGHIATALPF